MGILWLGVGRHIATFLGEWDQAMVYRRHNKLHLYLPLLCSYGASPSPSVPTNLFSISVSLLLFFIIIILTSLLYFLDSTYKWYRPVFVFPWLVSLSTRPFKSIYVAVNGKISFYLKKSAYYVHTLLHHWITKLKFNVMDIPRSATLMANLNEVLENSRQILFVS